MVSFDHKNSYYEILEVNPEASPKDIREAYLRLKKAYGKDSVAVYTLMDGDKEDVLREIEEAYQTLSQPEKKDDNAYQDQAMPNNQS